MWLLSGREGDASPLAQAVGLSDIEIHEVAGWVLAAVGVAGAVFGARGTRALVVESLTFRRSDLGWFKRWPSAMFTGRFGRHDGAFDPGQRLANIVMVGGLAVLVGSGIGLVLVSGGELFASLLRVHKVATYVVIPVIVGHVLVAAGLLRGYRGVWRSMHGRGRVDVDVARRLWPAWAERHTTGRD